MLKRTFDILVSTLALIVLAPVFAVVAIAIKISSPGPIFYRATRVGRYGVPFKLYKFRSMVVDADKIGGGITTAQDSRITPIGRFLRRTKLDELPQLLNVLRGEMSLVGPRPEDPRYVALYTEEQRRVLNVRPGITSPASVRYRNEQALLSGADWEAVYVQQILPNKLAIELQYIERATLLSDLSVLWQTFQALFR
ncbi:MAG: sugar transferase [Chloroflexota bacterium]|jgi:lipopolysaccharide/colanic/teichoic acid biosynthesis glycosyltransferase|nr:MAG: sugar transferase [Chloroflexota bacterium]